MKLSKTTTAFLGMLSLMLAAMFYTPIATAMPMQAEYHAMQADNDNGLVAIVMTAPFLVVAGMVAIGYGRIINKSKFTYSATGGEDGDEEEIRLAHGGGVVFRS